MSTPLAVTPGQTIGPVLRLRVAVRGRWRLWCRPAMPGRSGCTGWCSTAPASRCPTRWSRCGSRGPDGHVVGGPGRCAATRGTFTGWGRAATDNAGHYSFTTLSPGAGPAGAPFFALTVFARGLLDKLFTRAYLPLDEASAAADALLAQVPSGRRDTLIAAPDEGGYRFDIRLQGDDETVFLAYPGSPA